jgi:hypothetical protein
LEDSVKTLAWLLTAAAILIGADVFVMSSDATTTSTATTTQTSTEIDGDRPVTLHGGNGIPTPPTD